MLSLLIIYNKGTVILSPAYRASDEESQPLFLLHLYDLFGNVLSGIDPSGSVLLNVFIITFYMR